MARRRGGRPRRAASPAQDRSPSLVRDAETEQLLREYAVPIFRAAGINAKATKIILVNDRSFNAFVANGQKIFINVGALMDAETPNEIIGVIAHETGHIAGGHLARLREQISNAQILSVIGMLAGAGAVVGAAQFRRTGRRCRHGRDGRLYRRPGTRPAQPSRLPALRGAGGGSGRGALPLGDRAVTQGHARHLPRASPTAGMFRSRAVDPYLVSHPLPSERISQLERLAKQSPHFSKKDPPGPAGAPRSDARQAVRLRRARRHGAAALSAVATPRRLRAMPARCSPTGAGGSSEALRRSTG